MRKTNPSLIVWAALVAAQGVCPPCASAATKFPKTAEDVLIIDCLLPGQVRKLGRINAFLSPRRPARLSQFECGLRGGEYVEFDRATLQSSLSVWLAAATAGEVEAMVMVGEAFAKGFGAAPDYVQALLWFQRAAEKGDARALQNLGHLHELGLGTAANRDLALDFYRRASGIAGERVVFTSTLFDEREITSELELTKAQLGQYELKLKGLQAQIASLQSDNAAKRAEVQRLRLQSARDSAAAKTLAQSTWLVLEEQIRQQELQISDQRSALGQLERAIAGDGGSAYRGNEALAQLGAVSLSLLEPSVLRVRGAPAVQAKSEQLKLVGRASPRNALKTLWVGTTEVKVDEQGLFNVSLDSLGLQRLVIGALDARGQRSEVALSVIAEQGQAAKVPASAAARENATTGARSWPKGLKRGKRWLLAVGNRNYQEFEDLGSPVEDAQAIATLLEQRFGFQTRVLRDATRLDMLLALDQLRRETKPDDDVLIYFAGHGVLGSEQSGASVQQGAWVPVDGKVSVPATWVSNRVVTDMLAGMPARNALVLADSCYGGTLTQSGIPQSAGSFDGSQWQAWATASGQGRSRIAMTAGGLRPVFDANVGSHSSFARALLTVLKRSNGVLEAQQLYREVSDFVALSGSEVSDLPTFAAIQFAGHQRGELLLEVLSKPNLR